MDKIRIRYYKDGRLFTGMPADEGMPYSQVNMQRQMRNKQDWEKQTKARGSKYYAEIVVDADPTGLAGIGSVNNAMS